MPGIAVVYGEGEMLNGLDLFSGIGGISLALNDWVRPIAYCENDRYAQAVLLSRMLSNELPTAPVWDDVTSLRGTMLSKPIDIIYGGFPCQDVSVAGLRKGLGAERSGLFFEIIRLAEEIKPTFVFLENVPGIRKWLFDIGAAFTDIGYDCRWDIVSAKEVGAPFEGKRWFCLAKAKSNSLRLQSNRKQGSEKKIQLSGIMEDEKIAAANCEGMVPSWDDFGNEQKYSFANWIVEGDDWDKHAGELLRMDNGISYRAHRIKSLGNAVVPLQAKEAFKRLIGLK